MDVDDQAAEDPHSNKSKRKYESSSEDEFEDPEYLDQSFDLLSNCVPVRIQEDFVVIKEKSVDLDRESKFYCKLLKFSIDWSLEEVLSIIEYLDREEFPNLFIFIIETENAGIKISENSSKRIKLSSELDQVKEKLLEFAQERPLILQITSLEENEVKFYYKDENGSKILQEIENIKKSIQKPNSFPRVLKAFFDGTIQSLIKLFEESPKKYENSLLIWRFLRTLDIPDTSWNKLMLKCAECGTKNELFAAIDDPFERDEWMVCSNAQQWFTGTIPEEPKEPDQHDVIESPQDEEMQDDGEVNNVNQGKDSTKASSLLHAAVENSNTEIIEYLIFSWSCFIQELPNDHKITISTAAYTKGQFKILCDLINKFDFPFPKDFNVDQCNYEELKSIANQRINFHKAIKNKNIEQITEFITNNRSLKVVFNPVNMSAMKYAINLKRYGTYFYLKSFGLKASEFTDLEKVLSEEQMKKATIFEKKQRRQNVEKAIISKHESVNLLCNRSRIHDMKMGNDQECHKQIRKWFEEIHDVKYCSILLKVAASCEDLKIIFDFESTSVKNSSLSNSKASGETYPTIKWIFIGAKSINNERDQKIKGVLAHELCHYAMRLVYENEDNPYYKYKEDIKKIFDEISNEINVWQTKEPNDPDDECNGVISSVYQLYTKEEFHLELIVRVVQILVEFGNNEDKITELEEKYKKLFDFWEQYVMPDLEYFNLKSREFVRKMNRICKLLDDLKSKNLELSTEKDIISVMNNNAAIVTSTVPKLLLINILKCQQNQLGDIFDTKTVFIDSDILNNQENWGDCKKMMKDIPGLKIVIDSSDGIFDELKDLKIHPDSSLIFVVQDDKQAENFKQYIPKRNNTVTNKVMDYDINDLTTESQENLLKSKINFQGNSSVSLHDLIVNKEPFHVAKELNLSKIIDVHLFNLLLGNKNVKINNVADDPLDFRLLYQPRQLHYSKLIWFSNHSVKEFLSKIKNEKYVLISDIAGNGKSWVTRNVSEIVRDLDPTKWVTYIDLKQFINVLKAAEDEKIEFCSFIADKIVKLKNNFEKEIFMRMYEIGKVFIIFDGFDEIAPNYAKFVCELAKSFEQNGGNQMLIATRNYFEVDLRKELKIYYSFRLNHFSKENGAEFITKSWILSEVDTKIVHTKVLFEENINNSQKFNKYLEFAQKLIEKVSMSGESIGMPQIYKIIAEISKDDKEATINLSLTELYRTLIQNLFQRWATEKGEIRKKANAESLEYEMNFYRFHQFLAIWSLFREYIGVFFVGYDPKEWKNCEIIACGIVALVDYEYEDDHHFELEEGEGIYRFVHETFREYFVADFITKELNKSSPHQEALKMFAELMTVKKYGVIRMFLDEKLESSVLHKIMPKMKVIPKFDKMFQDMNSFADIFERGLYNLIEFIILFLKTRNEGKISKILFNAALTFSQNPPQFLKFQEFLMKHCNNNFLIKLVKEEGIFLQLLRSNVEFEKFEEFLLNMISKIGSEIVKEGLKMKRIKVKNKDVDDDEDVDDEDVDDEDVVVNIFSLLCKTDLDLSKLENLLNFLDRHFSAKQTLETFLLRCDENETTLLQKVFKSYRNPLEYWIKIKKYFNTEETLLKELISKFDLEGNNILHCTLYITFDNFKHFLGEIFNIIDKDSIKNLLTRLNSRDRSR